MEVKFDENGLVPAIVQDAVCGKVLMQAYMNKDAYELTLSTGKAHYWSRSRGKLWLKGETSGHFQEVVDITLDCDGDCVLLRVLQSGVACHTGEYSCFHNTVVINRELADSSVLAQDCCTIVDRIEHPVEGSYTNYLWSKGLDKICKKIGEEASEVIIAAKNNDKLELACEISDLIFHLQILMVNQKLDWSDIFNVLKERSEKDRIRNW